MVDIACAGQHALDQYDDSSCAGQHALDQYDDSCLIINDQDFS